MNSPSILTSWDPVPRIPRVRQVSNIVTSGADIGTPKCKTERSPSSSVIAPVIIKSPAGAPDENTFLAVIRYPPSTFSATPEPPSQSDPPELSKTIFSSATLRKSGATKSRAASWLYQRHARTATWWVCNERANPVEPHAPPIILRTSQSSRILAPPPPRSDGTPAEIRPAVFRSA